MAEIEKNKERVINSLLLVREKLNETLTGVHLDEIAPILTRIDRSGVLPPWFMILRDEGRLPNLDGKTVGSIIEKLLVCVIERYVFHSVLTLSINLARGVDIPELELGVKSPSTNYATSEPYFSAYERLLGNEYDAVILLTNYQEAKKRTPFRLQVLRAEYLRGSEIADANLCVSARAIRDIPMDEAEQKKAVRFLAYVNHSDWEANRNR